MIVPPVLGKKGLLFWNLGTIGLTTALFVLEVLSPAVFPPIVFAVGKLVVGGEYLRKLNWVLLSVALSSVVLS